MKLTVPVSQMVRTFLCAASLAVTVSAQLGIRGQIFMPDGSPGESRSRESISPTQFSSRQTGRASTLPWCLLIRSTQETT
jgi:hypothetical protein